MTGAAEPRQAARAAGLRYVTDAGPGVRRRRDHGELRYFGVDGREVDDPAELARFTALAIPPAWTDVWICPLRNGHLQATGRDDRGRKQYRYHPRWRAKRDETKFHRMVAFGEALPAIRARVREDLGRHGLPREKVLATVVQLLDEAAIRVGNDEYARDNNTFGLTTLENDHVAVRGSTLHFAFAGKGGRPHRLDLHDRRLARIVKRCRDLPGHELFQYLDEEEQCHAIDSGDVNEYLQEIAGDDFTAKDFRTWHGTVVAAYALKECMGEDTTPVQARHNVVEAMKAAAAHLCNTPAICRKSYVYPGIVDAYMDGSLPQLLEHGTTAPGAEESAALSAWERDVLALLRRLEAEKRPSSRRGAA